jgi:hypothetical protein
VERNDAEATPTVEPHQLRIPRHGGHRFRFNAATDSDGWRPPVPSHRGQSFEEMIVIAG